MSEMTSYLGWKIDFANPPGAPAFFAPDSMQWRIYKNPIALGIGGIAAVLLEFADPRIRSGVWDHSTYKADPIGRSKRTGVAAMVGVYGPKAAAERVIAGVTNMHTRVRGETPSGRAYQALDVELLDWVAATAAYGFCTAYARFVAPLTLAAQDRFYREGATVGRLYGAQNPILSTADFDAMLARLAPGFEAHPIVTEFLDIIQSGRAAPSIPKFLHVALARASVSLLPQSVRDVLKLGRAFDLTWADTLALKSAGALAERIPVKSSPACQASMRLGLPYDFLYRSRAEQARLLAAPRALEEAPAS